MTENRRSANWPMIAGIAGVAAVIGFGAARGLAPASGRAPSQAPAASASAAAASDALDEVKIPNDYLSAANIAVEPVASGDVGNEILAPATVAAIPGGEAVVVARASGTVQRVNRRLGDSVRAGEVLATVDSLDAATMAAERRVAQAKADLARKRTRGNRACISKA